MSERKELHATEGHILTNGTNYVTDIWLAEGESGEDYYEITLEEYAAIENSEEATDEDYRNALNEMGVKV